MEKNSNALLIICLLILFGIAAIYSKLDRSEHSYKYQLEKMRIDGVEGTAVWRLNRETGAMSKCAIGSGDAHEFCEQVIEYDNTGKQISLP